MTQSRFVVITGVSRGLGRAMVAEFIRLGHKVAGCARSAEAIRQLCDQYGAPHDFDVVDVAVDSQVHSWAERLLKLYGAPDLLVRFIGQ